MSIRGGEGQDSVDGRGELSLKDSNNLPTSRASDDHVELRNAGAWRSREQGWG